MSKVYWIQERHAGGAGGVRWCRWWAGEDCVCVLRQQPTNIVQNWGGRDQDVYLVTFDVPGQRGWLACNDIEKKHLETSTSDVRDPRATCWDLLTLCPLRSNVHTTYPRLTHRTDSQKKLWIVTKIASNEWIVHKQDSKAVFLIQNMIYPKKIFFDQNLWLYKQCKKSQVTLQASNMHFNHHTQHGTTSCRSISWSSLKKI